MSKDRGFFVATLFFCLVIWALKLSIHVSTLATKFTYKQRSGASGAKGMDPASKNKLFKNAIVRSHKNFFFVYFLIYFEITAREQIDLKKESFFF
jgi:hypothetical protein